MRIPEATQAVKSPALHAKPTRLPLCLNNRDAVRAEGIEQRATSRISTDREFHPVEEAPEPELTEPIVNAGRRGPTTSR